MTLEKLCGASADELEKMTTADLVKYFGDKLPITRPTPELRAKNSGKRRHEAEQLPLISQDKLAQARAIAEAAGITLDLSELE